MKGSVSVRRFFFLWCVFVLSFCVIATVLAAQAPAPFHVDCYMGCGGPTLYAQAPAGPAKAAPAAGPALDELEKAWLQNVILAQQLANTQCQGLESTKQFVTVKNDVTAKVEAKRPGFTMDWATGQLTAKK